MKHSFAAFVAVVALFAAVGCLRSRQPAGAREQAPVASAAAGVHAPAPAWTKPSADAIARRLSPLAFEVTQHGATEPAFHNAHFDRHEPGLYVDVVTGEPLFSSRDKFDSGTGWPSFTRPIADDVVRRREDSTLGIRRTEVLSSIGASHLGHVFDDGPAPTGERYCINSAALRFVPVERLAAEGYGAYAAAFASPAAAVAPSMSANACASPPPGEAPGCQATVEEAIVAGGCFWGVEDILRAVPGVLETEVGYTGGVTESPTYDDVHGGRTGHAEAVRVTFDPSKLSYGDLMGKWFFRLHDPTTPNRQGNDVGSQYRSAIFTTSDAQRAIAEKKKAEASASGRWKAPITTEIVPAGRFWPAEESHQDYLVKHPGGYTCHYLRD